MNQSDEKNKIIESLKILEKCTKEVLGDDSNFLDRDELAIKLYNETSVWVKYEAVTKAFEVNGVSFVLLIYSEHSILAIRFSEKDF